MEVNERAGARIYLARTWCGWAEALIAIAREHELPELEAQASELRLNTTAALLLNKWGRVSKG